MLSSPLLALAQITPTPTIVQVVAQPTMDLFTFILALVDRPAVASLLAAVATVLIWLTRRDQGEQRRELREVHDKVNGTSEQLRAVTERAAHAEGKLEGVTEVAPALAPTPPPVQVIVPPPDAQPGGRRRGDPPAPPTSAPVDQSPESHLR